jgi:hypothetical protein
VNWSTTHISNRYLYRRRLLLPRQNGQSFGMSHVHAQGITNLCSNVRAIGIFGALDHAQNKISSTGGCDPERRSNSHSGRQKKARLRNAVSLLFLCIGTKPLAISRNHADTSLSQLTSHAPFPVSISEREVEAPGGFEPPHKGFADLSLTTWVRRQKKRPRCLVGVCGNGASS